MAFDKFHVAGHLGDAVNKVRREEHERLQAVGDQRLKGTRFWWLYNPERSMSEKQWLSFESLRCSTLKTARAWSIKEAAMEVWDHAPRNDLESQWLKWYGWAIRSQLEPVKVVARMVKRHLGGIVLAAKEAITNASAEGLNSVVQMLKHVAHGYRNRERFRNAIYFHLGGLDLILMPLRRELLSFHQKAGRASTDPEDLEQLWRRRRLGLGCGPFGHGVSLPARRRPLYPPAAPGGTGPPGDDAGLRKVGWQTRRAPASTTAGRGAVRGRSRRSGDPRGGTARRAA